MMPDGHRTASTRLYILLGFDIGLTKAGDDDGELYENQSSFLYDVHRRSTANRESEGPAAADKLCAPLLE